MIVKAESLSALAFSLAFGLSCATAGTPPGAEEPERDILLQALDDGLEAADELARTAPPPSVAEDLLPQLRLERLDAGAPQDHFDLTVKNAPARELFMSLVEDTPQSIVLDPSVDGEITLTLKNVTVEDVMNVLRDIYGYEYRRTPYGYHVLSTGIRTRTFQVNYLNIRRGGESQTRVSSGQLTEDARSSGVTAEGALKRAASGTVSGSRISTRSQMDFWEELDRSLKTIVGTAEGRTVVTSPNTGIVIVRAPGAELREVERYLNSARVALARQVIIEAKVLEVTLRDGFQSGINWASLTKFGDRNDPYWARASQTGGGSSLGSTGLSENRSLAETFVLNPDALDLLETTNASAFGGVFNLVLNFEDFTTIIELLETQGNVRTLSSPRISTVNNQKAVIKVGTDEFFVTDVSSTTVTGAATTTTPDITLTPFFSGIALDVTPQIDDGDAIVMHVHPSVSEVTDQTKNISVGGVAQSIPLALSTIRESDSVVRARSGQIVVIGGLMKDVRSDSRAATPWIHRIPLLGKLFRHQADSQLRSELVILLRAQIVTYGTWRAELEETRDRVEGLGRPAGFATDNPRLPRSRGSRSP